MDGFFKFLKLLFSPIGLIVLGVVLIVFTITQGMENDWQVAMIPLIIGIVWLFIKRKRGANAANRPASEGVNDLFIELNKGSTLTIKDGYIYGPDDYKLGSIIGSGVHSRGRQIGNIKGNDIYGLDGNLICHIEGGHLVK